MNAIKCFFIFTPTAKAYNSRIPINLKKKVDNFINEKVEKVYGLLILHVI